MGAWLSTMPPTCWPRLLGACISWGAISRRSRQPGASTRSLKAGSPSISSADPRRVGVDLPGESRRSSLRQPQGLAQVLDDALHRVGGYGPGQDGVVRPEATVYPLYQLVPEAAGEV